MMVNTFEWLLSVNLEFSLLLAGIIALRWLLKKTAKVYNVYWLWLLILLIPLTSMLATSMPPPQQALVAQQLKPFQPSISPLFSYVIDTPANLALHQVELASAALNKRSRINFLPLLAAVWFMGGVFFLSRLVLQHRALRAQLRSAQVAISFKRGDSYYKPAYPIIGTDIEGFSPAVYGFFKPQIYFPATLYGQLNIDQRSLILEHEEQHIRQGHLWLNLLCDIVVCINWFNPLFYVARHLFRHDQEVLCDTLVLKNHNEPRQHVYGHALLSTVSATHSVSLLCSWKMFDQLEERIMNIKSKHPQKKLSILIAVMAVTLTLSTLHTIASANERHKNSAETAKVINLEGDPIESEKAANSISIVNIDDDGDKRVTIKTYNKTYRLKNGERFIEEDNLRRALTEDESREMADLLDKSERYFNSNHNDKRAIFDQEHVYAITYDHDEPSMDADALEAGIMKELEKMRVKDGAASLPSLSMINDDSDPEVRIRNALENIKASDDSATKSAIRSLENAQKQLEESREQMRQDQQRALDQLEQLERIIEQG